MPKGNYTALQQLKPIETDFGKIAREEQALFNEDRALKKAEKAKAEKERDAIEYNPLGYQKTGIQSLDDALYQGISMMNEVRYTDWKKARNDPKYAKSDEYIAKTANRANYAKNLKTFTESYSKYAESVLGMGGDLSDWNSDALKEVNAFFKEEKVQFSENKYGEPTAMIASIDPDTGEYVMGEDGKPAYTESSLAKVMKGTGIYDIVPKVDVIASVKSIGDILGDDLKDKKAGWRITSEQLWENRKDGAKSLVESELGSVKNPTALAKRMWSDEMGMSKADWDEEAYTKVTDKMLEKVQATYDEKLKIAYNYAGENQLSARKADDAKDVITPSLVADSNTGVPVLTKIPGGKGSKKGYAVSFGKGVLTSKTEGSSEMIDNVWVAEDGKMFATKKKATRVGKNAVSVIGSDGEIDNAKLLDVVMGGGGGSTGWKVETVTEELTEVDFTNLSKNPKVRKSDGGYFKDGKSLKDNLKEQYKSMPKGGELNSLGETKEGNKIGELDEI